MRIWLYGMTMVGWFAERWIIKVAANYGNRTSFEVSFRVSHRFVQWRFETGKAKYDFDKNDLVYV